MRHPHWHRLAALLPLQILAEAPSHSLPFPLAPEALSSALGLGLGLGQSPRPRAKLTPTRNNTLHCGARGPQDPRTIKKDTPTQTPPSPTNFSRLGERPLHSIHRHTQLSANFSVPRQKKYPTQKQRQWQSKQHPPSLPPSAHQAYPVQHVPPVATPGCAEALALPQECRTHQDLCTRYKPSKISSPPLSSKHTHTPQRCLICTTRMPMESMGNAL